MNIPSSDIVTACWAAVAYLVGKGDKKWAVYRARRSATEQTKKELATQGPTCSGCTHGYSYHKGMGLPCGYVEHRTETKKTAAIDGRGKPILDNWDKPVINKEVVHVGDFPCGCQAYDGPEPLPLVVSY